MSNLIWLVVVIAIVVIVALIVVAAMSRRKRLRPLSEESCTRYAQSWRDIEARFVDSPQQAVSDGDALAVALYRERGGRDNELPSNVREARELVRRDSDDSMTENLRRAMQQYRSAVEDLLGTDPRDASRRAEVAS